MSTHPEWLAHVIASAESIKPQQLTAFLVPEDSDARQSAVLMLFGEGPAGPDLVLTERSHTMRSHPGQVSFPGGRVDPGETLAEAAVREAQEEAGIDPASVEIVATLPELWLPPSNHAVTTVIGWWEADHVPAPTSPDEVHAIYRVPVADLANDEFRITVTSPAHGWRSPGFLIGPDKDVLLWGFTGGVIERFLIHLGWLKPLANAREVEIPAYMLLGRERADGSDLPEVSE